MSKKPKSVWYRLGLILSTFVITVATIAAVPAQKAGAVGCHFFYYEASAGGYAENGYAVNYTPQYTVQSNSGCVDINLYSIYAPYDPYIGWICTDVRVRFYPSSGGNYANGWKWYCPNRTMVVASNVLNGTKYKLEFKGEIIVGGEAFD